MRQDNLTSCKGTGFVAEIAHAIRRTIVAKSEVRFSVVAYEEMGVIHGGADECGLIRPAARGVADVVQFVGHSVTKVQTVA